MLLEIMMAKRADERQSSWDDLLNDIDLVKKGQFPATPRPSIGMSNVMQPGATHSSGQPRERDEKKGMSTGVVTAIAGLSVIAAICILLIVMKISGAKPDAPPVARQDQPASPTATNDRSHSGHRDSPLVIHDDDESSTANSTRPADIAERVRETRTKTDTILSVNPQNVKEKFKELKPGMLLHFEKGKYLWQGIPPVIHDGLIIEAEPGAEIHSLCCNAKKSIIRNLNVTANILAEDGTTIVDSRMGYLDYRGDH